MDNTRHLQGGGAKPTVVQFSILMQCSIFMLIFSIVFGLLCVILCLLSQNITLKSNKTTEFLKEERRN